MKRWWRLFAGCAGACALLAVLDSEVLFAQDNVDERRPRFELGIGAWISTGETKWAHNASSIPGLGDPTSKLTYKDVGTNIFEVTGRLWATPKWFGRLNVGYGAIGGGRLTDDDYLAVDGGAPSSETFSNITGDSTWYLNADVGRRAIEFPNSRGWLDLFVGYQYWYQRYTANGLAQIACSNAGQTVDLDPPNGVVLCSPNRPPISSSITVVTNTANWHSIRVGGTSEYRLTRRFSVQGTVAFIPVSVIDNKDIHHLRTSGPGALQQNPSISMLGYGIGADVDVGARFMILKNFYANVGYRIWWNYLVDGNVTFHNAAGPSEEFPLTQFQSIRQGLTFGLNYSF